MSARRGAAGRTARRQGAVTDRAATRACRARSNSGGRWCAGVGRRRLGRRPCARRPASRRRRRRGARSRRRRSPTSAAPDRRGQDAGCRPDRRTRRRAGGVRIRGLGAAATRLRLALRSAARARVGAPRARRWPLRARCRSPPPRRRCAAVAGSARRRAGSSMRPPSVRSGGGAGSCIRMPHARRPWQAALTRRTAASALVGRARMPSDAARNEQEDCAATPGTSTAVRFTLRVASRRRRNPNVVVEARKSDLVRRHCQQC